MQDLPDDVDKLFAAAVNSVPGEDTGNEYWEAVRQLHRRPERAVFERAAALCASSTPRERQVGADVLAQLGAGTTEERRPFAAESVPLLDALLGDPSEEVVVSAIHALAHLGRADMAAMRRLASHPSMEIRYAVAHALTNRDEADAIEMLFTLMRDIESHVRDWATFALASQTAVDTAGVRQALHERLADSDSEIRGEALVGLARRGDRSIIDHLVREFDGDPGGLVFDAADEILKHVPDEPRITAALSKWRAGS